MDKVEIVITSAFLVLFTGIGGYFMGTNSPPTPNQVAQIEKGVYTKTLGDTLGTMKYNCDKMGGELLLVPNGNNACVIRGDKLK